MSIAMARCYERLHIHCRFDSSVSILIFAYFDLIFLCRDFDSWFDILPVFVLSFATSFS